jgi:hypothetical protein
MSGNGADSLKMAERTSVVMNTPLILRTKDGCASVKGGRTDSGKPTRQNSTSPIPKQGGNVICCS